MTFTRQITVFVCSLCLIALWSLSHKVVIQDGQLSQRDRAAGCIIVFTKSGRLELGDNILRTL